MRYPVLREELLPVRVQKVRVPVVCGTVEQADLTVLAESSQPHPAPCLAGRQPRE